MSAPENVPDGSASPALGDYLLGQLIAEDEDTRTYHARQRAMGRGVVLVMQKGAGREQQAASFLGDVRAKAAIEHPGIGSVYEAVENGLQESCGQYHRHKTAQRKNWGEVGNNDGRI